MALVAPSGYVTDHRFFDVVTFSSRALIENWTGYIFLAGCTTHLPSLTEVSFS